MEVKLSAICNIWPSVPLITITSSTELGNQQHLKIASIYSFCW